MPPSPSYAPTRRGVSVAALLTLAVSLCAGAASGSKPRCRLEALVPRDGELLALGGVVELEGQVDADRPPSTYALLLNGKEVARADRGQPFERSGQDAYVVLAVEISALYAPAIEKVKEALREFLEALPPRTKVRIIQYGAEINDQGSFVPAAAVSLDDILPDDEGDIQLASALTAGLRALQAAERLPAKAGQPAGKEEDKDRVPPRRLLIAISDGLNPSMERRGFRQLGDNLRKAGIAFFPIAFSPRDDRFPLLNLGELAKRSGGTFRWAQKDEQIKEQFLSLAEELKQLQVLRFAGKKVAKLDEEDLARATFSLRCGDLVSPPYTLRGEALKPPSGSRWYLWVAGVLGGLVTLWGIAQLLALWLRRRAPQVPQQPPWPQQQWPQQAGPAGTGAYPQQPVAGTGAYPQQPVAGTGAYPQQPAAGTGAYPQQPAAGTGAYPQQPDHGRVVALPSRSAGSATIILIGGPAGGQQVALTPPVFTLGKGVASGPQALQVSDPTVSSRHCELRHDPAGWVVVDLGSTNGTYVNDHRITAPTRLRDGDLVRIGVSTQFKLRLD